MSKPKNHLRVEDAYNLWADTYDTHDNPMVAAAREILGAFSPHAAGCDVLEIGCGTGANLAMLLEAGARHVSGIELSRAMLEHARKRSSALQLHQADAMQRWPFGDASVDWVVFSLTLEHMPDLHVPFREAHRVLRPRGEVFVVEIHPDLAGQGVAAHFEVHDTIVTMPTFVHRLDEYRGALVGAGLQLRRVRHWRAVDFSNPHPKLSKRNPSDHVAIEICAQSSKVR
jgi:malonyl-CoA O-methyltransferase